MRDEKDENEYKDDCDDDEGGDSATSRVGAPTSALAFFQLCTFGRI